MFEDILKRIFAHGLKDIADREGCKEEGIDLDEVDKAIRARGAKIVVDVKLCELNSDAPLLVDKEHPLFSAEALVESDSPGEYK